ncbi:WD40-repeat-containing domain protein [Pyronema domesticum]|uniref:Uncharacterized protein n=1 Tax=Pyronema omphalodes (strain CBS 100304) TaxID=1076935 RepID=U4LPK8_PYROM|nr:WD40-repeat-containing domain protein [Pyronema domesticum]CCX33870.1 Similar to hypothetical protein [Tuber melanosporum Mel28]; acc. no. XP_002840988 [Pyronema omphalodes CBS 100304]
MPAADSPQVLIARYLQSNGYDKTLAAFFEETNLTIDNIKSSDSEDALTIEKVLDEKRLYDLAVKVEKVEISEAEPSFTEPYPSEATNITSSDVVPSNILFTTIVSYLEPFDGPVLITTAADRGLRIYSAQTPFSLLRNFTAPTNSAILYVEVISPKCLVLGTMTGLLVVISADTGETLQSVPAHTKYTTRIIHSAPYLISASYDKTICLHRKSESADSPLIGDLVGKLDLPTPPEALCVLPNNTLVFSRRDSTSLFYHSLESGLPCLSTRNLSSAVWAGWHPMAIAPHPSNPDLLAVVTSSVPHMKFLLVKTDSEEVIKEVFTGAPQSAYSTPIVVWRPDASGVWVNADEGVVRGVEVKTAKVVARLQVCEKGEKVRALWAGVVDGKEVLVTGAFDKGLKVWRVKE